ncbi:hypothetical protein PIB30_062683 [Stylosanthes scabra]|uniref:Putative plant transposon protein domain-containing protein n=1 Tax=Stylosanthes scabra TaxID=79078 RepID=A0ABU6VJN4_9FABA|nr:hypothetical protein [Stylosanthes scabra]
MSWPNVILLSQATPLKIDSGLYQVSSDDNSIHLLFLGTNRCTCRWSSGFPKGFRSIRSFVRGVPIDFSPENIRNVMRFRAQVQDVTTDFETQKEHDQQLDRVLTDLCMPVATWKLSTGQQRVPIHLRRQELNPIARAWHELSIHSLIPSSNRSEIPVIRAILIHCIMKGEDVRAEDIIADNMVRMAQGIKEKGKLGFPSTIYKLCL